MDEINCIEGMCCGKFVQKPNREYVSAASRPLVAESPSYRQITRRIFYKLSECYRCQNNENENKNANGGSETRGVKRRVGGDE